MQPAERGFHAVGVGIVGVVEPDCAVVLRAFHSHARQDAGCESFGDRLHGYSECVGDCGGAGGVVRLMRSGERPVHRDTLAGAVIEQFKRAPVDISTAVKCFHDGTFACSVRTDFAGSGRFEHNIESCGSERNDCRSAGGEMRENFGFLRCHAFE